MASISSLPKLSDDQVLHVSNQGMEYILKNFDPNVPQRNFIWATDYKVELPVRVKKSGPGSELPQTYPEMWFKTLQKFGNNPALTFQKKPNQWVTLTYKQYYDLCLNFAKALIALGITNHTAVNIIGFNSPQWAIAFTGSIFGHYLPIGIYTTNAPEACQYIANHSGCEIVILQDRNQLKKYAKILDKVPKIRYFVVWKDSIPEDLPAAMKQKVLTWDQLIEIGMTKYNPKSVEDTIEYRLNEPKPGNCCTFIYTSGTTGPPKAVMISHDNYTWTAHATIKRFDFDSPQRLGKGRMLSLLPLSHVAAQITDFVISTKMGYNLYFADPSALQGNLVRFLQICRPTAFSTVPRLWQKMEEKIVAIGAQTTGIKRKLADWAKSNSPQGTYAQINGGEPPAMWGLAKKLVFNKIKENLGLDKCQLMFFSAAPMRQSTRAFFMNLNIFLYNCFGMSQLSGPETFTNPKKWKNFTDKEFLREAGRGLDGLTIAIDNPDNQGNGQICLRGRNTFMGYFKNEQQTKSTIDRKGFVHSGDVGKVDSDGNLTITGRIKQLIITAGGQNVAPVLIENQVNTVLPIFSQVIVIGDKRKYLTALLCLKLKSPQLLTDEVVEYISKRGSTAKTVKQALQCEALRKIIQEGIDLANTKAISRAQKITKFKILPVEFSIDGGQLTPTIKLKRKVINQKYKNEIQSLYIDAKL